MPLFDYFCINGHQARDLFVFHLGVQTMICDECGESMTDVGFGMGQTWFRENAPRLIHNMGPEPVLVRSAEEHKKLMRERGLEWSTGWQKKKTGGWV